MTLRRLFASGAAVLTAACALTLLPADTASAHPLGNFTVNRYDGLVAAPGELRVHHVEDLAEIPATQAGPDIERLGMAMWARERCAQAAADSRVTVDGRTAALTAERSDARVRPGQAGLDTLRVECELTAPLPKDKETVALGFRGAGAASGPGWREVTARGDRMTLTASDVPEKSISAELTRYPEELLSSPADTASAALRVRPGGPALAGEESDAPAASVLPRGADRWTRALDDLVARHDLTAGFAALALLIAVVLGAMHALAPGHGKTIMAATAAARGGQARMKDVLPMAASVTVTHTLGVVALGLLVTAGSAAAPSVIAWLGVASGLLVTLAGASLVRRALRNRAHTHHHGGHTHTHGHGGHPPPPTTTRPTTTATRTATTTSTITSTGTATRTTPRTPTPTPTRSSTPTAASPTATPSPRPSAAPSSWASRAASCPARPPSSCWSAPRPSDRPGSDCCSSSRTASGWHSPSRRPGTPSSRRAAA